MVGWQFFSSFSIFSICDPIQQKVTCLTVIEIFTLSNRRLNKLSNYTKFVKIEVILLKVQVSTFTNCIFYFILFIFYTLFCSLSQNTLSRQDVPLVVMGHLYKDVHEPSKLIYMYISDCVLELIGLKFSSYSALFAVLCGALTHVT